MEIPLLLVVKFVIILLRMQSEQAKTEKFGGFALVSLGVLSLELDKNKRL